MKTLHRLALCFIVVLASACATAATYTASVSFDHPDPEGTEYVVEHRQPDGTWLPVASGPASPIVYPIQVARAGDYVVRVRAKHAQPDGTVILSEPSNEAPALIAPGKPGNAKTTVAKP